MHIIAGVTLLVSGVIIASPSLHNWFVLAGRGPILLVIIGMIAVVVGALTLFVRSKF